MRADRRRGSATANSDNRTALVRGGDCDEQGKGNQIDRKQFALQPGTAALNASATCMPVGLTIDQASIRREGSRIVEFKAYHQNQGGFIMGIGEDQVSFDSYSFAWFIFVRTTYLFQLATGTDAVQLSNVAPPPDQPLAPDSDQKFAGHVAYTLGSKDSASLRLELTDAGGKPLAASDTLQISSRTSSAVDLVIPTAHLPATSGTVTLHAALRDSGAMLLKEDTRVFNVGCSGTNSTDSALAAQQQPRAGCDSGTISLDYISPASGEVVFANDEHKTPVFSAVVTYFTLTENAEIVLQISDQSGKPLGTTAIPASPGAHTVGRKAGCPGPADCFSLARTDYGTNESVSVVALLRRIGSTDVIARSSPPITYRIVTPKITLTLGSQSPTGSFTPVPSDTIIEGGARLAESVRRIILDSSVIQVAYDTPGPSAELSIRATTDEQFIETTRPIVIKQGTGIETFDVGGMKVPAKGTAIGFVAFLRTSTGQTYQSLPLIFPMETVYPGPPTPPTDRYIRLVPDPSDSKHTRPIQFSVPLTYQMGPDGATLQKHFRNHVNVYVSGQLVGDQIPSADENEALRAGPGTTIVSFTRALPLFSGSVDIYADTVRPNGQCPCVHIGNIEWGFETSGTISAGAQQNIPVAGGSVFNDPKRHHSQRHLIHQRDRFVPNTFSRARQLAEIHSRCRVVDDPRFHRCPQDMAVRSSDSSERQLCREPHSQLLRSRFAGRSQFRRAPGTDDFFQSVLGSVRQLPHGPRSHQQDRDRPDKQPRAVLFACGPRTVFEIDDQFAGIRARQPLRYQGLAGEHGERGCASECQRLRRRWNGALGEPGGDHRRGRQTSPQFGQFARVQHRRGGALRVGTGARGRKYPYGPGHHRQRNVVRCSAVQHGAFLHFRPRRY